MFSYRDLQILISGADTEVNVDDLVTIDIYAMYQSTEVSHRRLCLRDTNMPKCRFL
jgi:hypothetical protein